MTNLTVGQFRDAILRIDQLANQKWVQNDSELKRRIGVITEQIIEQDDILKGFLGRGGPAADRDFMAGNTNLEDSDV